MNRRSFFAVLPVAVSPVALAATALAYSRQSDTLPPATAGVNFAHGIPNNSNSYGICLTHHTDVKNHGGLVIHEGELYIKKPNEKWRQIS
jgi:hypothetical protein